MSACNKQMNMFKFGNKFKEITMASKNFTKIELIAVFIQGVMADFKIHKEYLTLGSIHSNFSSTKGTDVFHKYHKTLQRAHFDISRSCFQ